MYIINDAHNGGVTALSLGGGKIYSGGGEGDLKVWIIHKNTQQLEHHINEHNDGIVSLEVSESSQRVLSASRNGICIVWNMKKFSKIFIFFVGAYITKATFGLDNDQVLTAGSDGKIIYWLRDKVVRVLDIS
jgi:WD40 repeat protein